MVFSRLVSCVAYYASVCYLTSFGYLIIVNKKSGVGALDVSDSLKKAYYLISKCSCQFWFSGPFVRCLYFWGVPVSGHITTFIRSVWIVTSPVVLLVFAQSFPYFWTEYVWTGFFRLVEWLYCCYVVCH